MNTGKLFVAVSILLLVAASMCLHCSGDKSVEPRPVKNYPVFFADINTNRAFRYFPATGQLDTFALPFQAQYIHSVTPDGTQLIISNHEQVVAVDVNTEDYRQLWPVRARYGGAISPDGSLIALEDGSLRILDFNTLETVYFDSIETLLGSFSRDGRKFYTVANPIDGGNYVYCVHLDSGFAVTKYSTPTPNPYHVVPSDDERCLYLYYQTALWTGRFEVYDIAADSVIYFDYVSPGQGWVGKPSAQYVLYTNPGPFYDMGQPPPPNAIYVYGIESNSFVKEISTSGYYADDTVRDSTTVGDVVITADGRWAVGVDYAKRFVAVDLSTLTVVRFEKLGPPLVSFSRVVTPQPN